MLTTVRRLCGQWSMGPSGVWDQSSERIRFPISPPLFPIGIADRVSSKVVISLEFMASNSRCFQEVRCINYRVNRWMMESNSLFRCFDSMAHTLASTPQLRYNNNRLTEGP